MSLVTALMCLTLLSPREGAAVALRTYEIVFHAFCHTGSDFCGWPTAAALENHWRGQMRGVNEIWRPNQVSFRIAEFNVHLDDAHASIGHENDSTLGMVQALRNQAADDPGRIWVFLFEDGDVGWSAIPPWPSPCVVNVCAWGDPCVTDSDCGDLYHYGVFLARWCLYNHLAHELGHHFCQRHTATAQDRADQGAACTWDGDGLTDTPPDPGGREVQQPGDTTATGFDEDASGNLINGHDWCEDIVMFDVDPNGFHQQRCDVQCYAYDNGALHTTTVSPKMAPVMAPWGRCIGPYITMSGIIEPGFTPQEAQRVNDCILEIPERQAYVDVCPHDTDHDGLCDDTDPCPLEYTADPPVDFDGDGIPDNCDNCPWVSNPDQGNVDLDDAGDDCDINIDNDACLNVTDIHPYDAQWVAGTTIAPGCPELSGPYYVSESVDSDSDGILNCADPDDDNDGVDDEDDICPLVAYETSSEDCQMINLAACMEPEYAICRPCPPEIIGRLEWVINPDYSIDFHRVEIINDVVYLGGSPGLTNRAMVRAFDGTLFNPGGVDGLLELQLVDTRLRQMPIVLAEFAPADLEMGPLAGRAVAVTLRDGEAPRVEGTWTFGQLPGAVTADTDGDGVPNPADNCLLEPNPEQTDRDHDGYGNACDADFSQDDEVDADEVAFVENCIDVPIDLPVEIRCGLNSTLPLDPPPDAETVILSEACAAADLDSDGRVTADDLALAELLEDGAPGPSGAVEPVVEPGDEEEDPDAGMDVGAEDVGDDDLTLDAEPSETETDAPSDTGAADASQPTETDDDGCGCGTTGGAPTPVHPYLVFCTMFALALVRRRR